MPLKQRFAFWAAPLALALPLLIAACVPAPLPPVFLLEEAAHYDWLDAGQRYSEPTNAWVRNKPLERFLLKAYAKGGIDVLKSQYGFECGSLSIVPPCTNCRVCRMTLQMPLAAQEVNMGVPYGSAPMIIQLWIGPDPESFSAMTYWERPTVSPDVGR